jgi:hypothetical protein
MVLRSGFILIAQKLQEAAEMSHKDVRARLSDAVNDAHRGTGHYGSYVDHTGDGESGDCIYYCDGDLRKAPYELGNVGGKLSAKLSTEDSVNVMPVTSYAEEADDDDHYAAMQESFKSGNIYTDLPVYERFISKGERDAADEGSFAGKGKSFPILKPSDVGAAVHAMGRAGSSNYGMAQLKANIIRIAKKKGWTNELPKAWRNGDSDSKESAGSRSAAASSGGTSGAAQRESSGTSSDQSTANVNRGTKQTMDLRESAACLEPIVLREAKADYEIKLIAPGKGSSAFYPAEVLKRDGPKVFTPGTHVYLNHPTQAEEAARPEGDVKNLAGVLTTAARYDESHPKGEGLYARMKVFQDHAQIVEEKAAHVGMSIRASGVAESGKRQDGLPVLKELTGAESVDVVTRAGAGGMILTEAAKPAKEGDMTLEEARALIAKENAPIRLRLLKDDAKEETYKVLEGLSLHDETKQRIIERVLELPIPEKDGVLDSAKLRESIVVIAKKEGEYASRLTGGGRVTGMGASIPFQEAQDPEKIRAAEKAQRKQEKRMREATVDIYTDLLGDRAAAEKVAGKVA